LFIFIFHLDVDAGQPWCVKTNEEDIFSQFWDRPVPIFSDVRFSYLALVQDKKKQKTFAFYRQMHAVQFMSTAPPPPPKTGKSYSWVSEISLSCTFYQCLILFLTFISSCVLFDSYVLLTDDHVNNVSYFLFMPIKKVIQYFCVLREGYYVIIWLIVRICVFIKDWKLIYSELFILKRKSMENSGGRGGGGSWHKLYSMHLPVKRKCFFLSCTSAR
jgi:hypothetical protein